MRWYTVPCDEHSCFQHLRAIKEMGSGAAARVWQEQTNHKLVRHLASDPTRYYKTAGRDGMARCSIGCCPSDVEEEVKELLNPTLVRWRWCSCSAAVSRRHLNSLQSLITRPSHSLSGAIRLFESSLSAVVRITTLIAKGVVKVESGLTGIIQGENLCQDRLHNHRFQLSRAAKILWLSECVD